MKCQFNLQMECKTIAVIWRIERLTWQTLKLKRYKKILKNFESSDNEHTIVQANHVQGK